MALLSRVKFIDDLATKLQWEYLVTFVVLCSVLFVIILTLIIIFLLLIPARKKKKLSKKLAEEVPVDDNYLHDPVSEGEPLLSLEPEAKGFRESESGLKIYGGSALRPDIGDSELLDIIYTEIIQKREGISRSAFLDDAMFSNAYLEYIKERLVRFQLRGFTTREAINIFFHDAPIAVSERKEPPPVLSEWERQSIKQQMAKAIESDSQTLEKHITALEKQIESLNAELAVPNNKKRKAEMRERIAALQAELAETRRKLEVIIEREAAARKKEADAIAARAAEAAAAQAAVTVSAPQAVSPVQVQMPTIVQPIYTMAQPMYAPMQQPVYAPPQGEPARVDYAERSELIDQLKVLLLVVNECRGSVKDLEFMSDELALRRGKLRTELARLGMEATVGAGKGESVAALEAAAHECKTELESVNLDLEICAGDKACLVNEIAGASNEINDIIAKLGLNARDIARLEEEVAPASGTSAKPERKGGKAAAAAAAAVAEQEAVDELAQLKKSYMKRMQEIEEERISFYREYATFPQVEDNGGVEKEPDITASKSMAAVPPGYVLLRKKDGTVAIVKRSSMPEKVRPAPTVPERIVKILPDGSFLRADGSMVRPDGKILRPSKTKIGSTEAEFREILLAERRELMRQKLTAAGEERRARESAESSEYSYVPARDGHRNGAASIPDGPFEDEIAKIASALKQGKKDNG